MKRYNDIVPPLIKWYNLYCATHNLQPRPSPPIKVVRACRRMLDPDTPNCPSRTDRFTIAEHFSKAHKNLLCVSVDKFTGQPVNPDDPFRDYHDRQMAGEYVPFSELERSVGWRRSKTYQLYQAWCKVNNIQPVVARPKRPDMAGPRLLNQEQIGEVLRLYQNKQSAHAIAKQFGVCTDTILFTLRTNGMRIRSKSEAQSIRWSQ